MIEWIKNESRTITVITDKNVNLTAYYTLADDNNYVLIPGTFTKNGSRYYLNHSFSDLGHYIIRIVDSNSQISDVYTLIDVIDSEVQIDIHSSLDSYPNKDNWKGLSTVQEQTLIDINTRTQTIDTNVLNTKSAVETLPSLTDIENSTVIAKKADTDSIQNTVNTLPTLLDIEGSTTLAMKSDISVVEAIVRSLPILSDIRNEMINITFGGLEIANNQLTIKDKDGTIIAIFDLFDQNGNPTMLAVYKREVVQ